MSSKAEMIKEVYPVGTRICCDYMPDDPYPIPAGSIGTVVGVDDAGQIMMKWDNGRSLSLIFGVDSFHVVQPDENLTEDISESEGQNIGM